MGLRSNVANFPQLDILLFKKNKMNGENQQPLVIFQDHRLYLNALKTKMPRYYKNLPTSLPTIYQEQVEKMSWGTVKIKALKDMKISIKLVWMKCYFRVGIQFCFRILVDKTLSFSWCAAVTDQINLSLKIALSACVNNVKLEFASETWWVVNTGLRICQEYIQWFIYDFIYVQQVMDSI